MPDAFPQADGGQSFFGFFESVFVSCELQRDGDVFQRRHGRDEVEILEDDAYIITTESSQGVFGHEA